MNQDARLSKVIDTMRLPLIYLVVIAHLVPFTLEKVNFSFIGDDFFVLVSEMFSHHVAKLSVRCYFLVSGYYFFKHYSGNLRSFLKRQYKSRFRTLLKPYLIWNSIAFLAFIFKNKIFISMGLSAEPEFATLKESSLLYMFWSGPWNFPLWFVRDLICMILISPLILYFIKYLKHYGVILLAILYLTQIGKDIPGFSLTAIFFFSLGAYFSLEKKNMLQLFYQLKIPAFILAIVFLFTALKYNPEPSHEYFVRLFILFGVITTFNLFAYLNDNYPFMNKLTGFSSLSFFIYVIHEVYIINWLKGFFYNLSLYDNLWMKYLAYWTIPVICIAIIAAIYYSMMKLTPRLFVSSLGDRIPEYNKVEEVFKNEKNTVLESTALKEPQMEKSRV